ncbi:hypothetical protein Q3G72_033702 [Acer saccharum]|nr:hypothetical protein Q3G72_033702 [Acer saccharum]
MGSSMNEEFLKDQVSYKTERVVFSEDFSCLFLNERLFQRGPNFTNYNDAVADDRFAVASDMNLYEDDRLLDSADIECHGYMITLQKQQKDLQCSDIESDIIFNILRETEAAEALLALGGDQSRILEGKETDICIKLTSQKLRLKLLRNSFLQKHLQDLFDKDAIEKSDAAGEELLADLAHDAGKNINKDCHNGRQTQDEKKNTMKKRKKENFRKAKESKATDAEKNFRLHQNDDVTLSTELGVSGNVDEIERRIAIEERMLEKNLEYQRRIENEAKQKFLNVSEGCNDVRQTEDKKKKNKKKKKKNNRKAKERFQLLTFTVESTSSVSKVSTAYFYFQLFKNFQETDGGTGEQFQLCQDK